MTADPSVAVGPQLLLVGSIPVDLTMRVARIPKVGEDLRASWTSSAPGGGYYVLRAARAAGMRVRFAGATGEGAFGDLVRGALADLGCPIEQPTLVGREHGWVLTLVDDTGERTFVSAPDAVVAFAADDLESTRLEPADLVYVSGYSLGLRAGSIALASWVSDLGAGHLVFCDLGPWGAAAGDEILGPVLRRVDWLSCSAPEAALLVRETRPSAACSALQRRTRSAGVLVRVGAAGCWLAEPGRTPVLVPAPEVPRPVDSTGAGDTHSGAFLAALTRGCSPGKAVAEANSAAAALVARHRTAFWTGRNQGLGPEQED